MSVPAYSPSSQRCCEGRQASYLRARKSPGGVPRRIDVARTAANTRRPRLPDGMPHDDSVRVVLHHLRMSPSDDRGAARGPVRRSPVRTPSAARAESEIWP